MCQLSVVFFGTQENDQSCLTNTNLLTIGKRCILTVAVLFYIFGVSVAQDISTADTEMHPESKKALDLQGLSANI